MAALGYSFFNDAVIRTHDSHRLLFQGQIFRSLDPGNAHQRILQKPQPVKRLGNPVPMPPGGFP